MSGRGRDLLGRDLGRILDQVRLAAGLVLAAELGHLAMVLGAWSQWALQGIFHTVAAVVLGVLAASLWLGPGRPALRRGLVVTLLLPVLWLASRTAGIPSILTLRPLPVGVVDVLTSVVEVAAAVLLARQLRRLPRPA